MKLASKGEFSPLRRLSSSSVVSSYISRRQFQQIAPETEHVFHTTTQLAG